MATELVVVRPQEDIKSGSRRPIIHDVKGLLFEAPIENKECCPACYDCCHCQCCNCLDCCRVWNMYPPIRESAYTRVMEGMVMWNRPGMKQKVNYKCCGLCVNRPKRKCFGCGGGAGDLFNVADNVRVMHYDQFQEARLVKSNICEKILCCRCDNYVILTDINTRWPASCCCCPVEGTRIMNVDPEYTEALCKQINDAREATLNKLHPDTKTFFNPSVEDLAGYSIEDSMPHHYYQPEVDRGVPDFF